MIQLNPQWLVLLGESRPLLGMDMQTFLDMVPPLFNFVVLFILMTWLLYGPVKRILKARADRIEGELNDAAVSKASAAELKAQYEAKVRDIEIERTAILDDARKQANERRDLILEEAKASAQDEKNRAAKDIALEQERVKHMVYDAIVDVSAEMAARLISASIDKNAHEKLFAEAMADLEATVFRQDSVTV
jgi:F-type H+-transporting ATPase subunit b